MRQTWWGRTALAGAAVVGSMSVAAPAAAQITIDFRTTDGGFTATSILGRNPWTWTSGTGWAVNGVSTPARQRLLSPVLVASGGTFSVDARHAFNFEQSSLTPTCFDGGAVFASINGGSFVQLAPTGGRPYTAQISTSFSNPLGGLPAFCGSSGGIVSSIFAADLAAGTTIQLALDGGWDSSFSNPNPNWLLQSVTVNLGATSVVPEPSTYALLAVGLGGVATIARRRRRA